MSAAAASGPAVVAGAKKMARGESPVAAETVTEPEPEPEVESINLLLRPVDYEWVMGDDWEVRVPIDWGVPDVTKMVNEARGIPLSRMYIRMPDGRYLDKKKEKWTLRRHQLHDGSVLQVEPTIRGGWLWNSLEWYRDKLVSDLGAALDAAVDRPNEDNMLTTEHLTKTLGLFVPPPLGDISLRTFIRSFPDVFYTHLDTTSGLCWVRRAKVALTLPTRGFYPAELGTVKHFRERRFNWDKYADIDDRKLVELDFEIPDVSYNVEVMSCSDLKRADTFGSSDPLGFVYWHNCVEWKEVGRTAQRRNTLNPEWRDARFVVSVNASFEVENCQLFVEFFDVDAGGPGEEDEFGDYLGCVLITGRNLQRLVADGRTTIKPFDLGPRDLGEGVDLPAFVGSAEDEQADIKGCVTLKGGKAGFEVNVQAARDLVPLPFPTSKPLAVVFWCGDELGETIPDSRNQRDPQWNETLGIPTLSATSKLEDMHLEVQVWASQGNQSPEEEPDPNYNPDLRHTFLGSVQFTGEELVRFLTSSMPYALAVRKNLKPSKNTPIKQRKKPVNGVLCLLGGLSGLVTQPGKMLEFSVVSAEKIAKLYKVWFSVDWNFVTTYKSPHVKVESWSAEFGQRFRLETSAGALDCKDSHIRFDFWESTEGSIGAMDPAYLGMIVIQGQELSDLADQPFAQIKRFTLTTNPSLEPRKQRMVRGWFNVRGGSVMARCENERVLIIYAARNLARANFGGFGTSDPFCEVHFCTKFMGGKNGNELLVNKKLIGRTEAINQTLQPVWDETSSTFFIPIPDIREYTEKELKKFLKDNEKLEKDGKEPRSRSMYDEMELQVAVYDEQGEGEKGTCLGVVYWSEAELLEIFESYEPVEGWYPLVKGKESKDPATRNASIGWGAEIKLGTTGHRYNSPEERRLEKEAEMAAAAAANAAAKAEAEALEFARLERELEEKQAAEVEEKRLAEEAAAKKAADAAAAEAETQRIFLERLAKAKADEAAAGGQA